jgi:predicted  nucleic acid-binding Zn-ribbon protein
MPPSLPSISSPSPINSSSAHLAHLQDLQHQVTVKQLALQTLQREYDSLLQKLERQRTKSQALEKKFEVSDAEINSLTDEKERLAGQVQLLETQVEELQQARDEARKMGADSVTQYMKIVEMAGRLQGRGVDDKKSWEKERENLLSRISELEGGPSQSSNFGQAGSISHGQQPFDGTQPFQTPTDVEQGFGTHWPGGSTPSFMQDDTATLKHEILNLKERISALESTLKSALDESKTIREAALSLASVGQRLQNSTNSALLGIDRSEEMS